MEKPSFLSGNFVIASIMKFKIKNFNESYVTLNEYNFIKQKLEKEFKEVNINLTISDEINKDMFYIDNVILLNKNINISDLDKFINYEGPIIVLPFLLDEDSMCEKLIMQKHKEMETYLIFLEEGQNKKTK